MLPYFSRYEKFKNNKILYSKFIYPTKKLDEVNHIIEKDSIFFAECNYNSDLIINEDYYIYEDQIKGYLLKNENLSNYIEEWVRTMFNLMTDYILFILNQKPLYFFCDNCNLPYIYFKIHSDIDNSTNNNNNINVSTNQNLKNNINNDKINVENNVQKYLSIEFANSLIKLMNFNNKINIKNNEIINKNVKYNNNNYYNNNKIKNDKYRIANPPPREKNSNKDNEEQNKAINIIYYDENIDDNVSDIYKDSQLFERIINNGIFILATEEKRFKLILDEIKKDNKNYNFHLIVSGSKCQKVMDILEQEERNIFQTGCIYTSNYNKYKNYIEKYDIIKNVYTEQDEIISFIKENENNIDIFQSYKLINFDNYMDKYYYFHKLISEQYKENILNNGVLYEEFSLALMQDMKPQKDLDLQSFCSILSILNNENRRENILKEYTEDTIYKHFNKWLNELDILSYRKISYFIALIMYGINDINNEKKGLRENSKLYRGLKMSYINLSFYERNINNIITLPSLTSCSNDKSIAECFSGRKEKMGYEEQYYPIEKRKDNEMFSILITIDYIYKDEWDPSAFDISYLSSNPDEKECIFLPFSFFIIKNVDINFDNYEANITLQNIGKKCLLEKKIQENKIIVYNEEENILEEKNEKEYDQDINKIIKEKYPFFEFETNETED